MSLPKKKPTTKDRLNGALNELASLPPNERFDVYKALRASGKQWALRNTVEAFDITVPIEDLEVDANGLVRRKAPRVFLSHSSSDKSIVRAVGSALTKKRIKVWIDEAELKLGDSLIHRLRDALDKVDFDDRGHGKGKGN